MSCISRRMKTAVVWFFYLAELLNSRVQHFTAARSGTIAIIFAFLVPIFFGAVGGAIDFARWYQARSQLQAAMDAAVLAAGRQLQLGGGSESNVISVGKTYLRENLRMELEELDVQFAIEHGNTVVARSTSSLRTNFLAVIGIPRLEMPLLARAHAAVDGKSGTHFEVAVMLDTTGSMAGQKREDLKAATRDLVNILVWEDQSEYTSRVALVPFSAHVNVGRDIYPIATGRPVPGVGSRRTCVRERVDPFYASTDLSPLDDTRAQFAHSPASQNCVSGNPIVPLTSNKRELHDTIDNLEAQGMTAGHLGVAWTWNMLSPNWSGVFGAAAGRSYEDAARRHVVNVGGSPVEVPFLRKVAVLMTDGRFNQRYSGASATEQALALCAAIKTKPIEVFTIGFDIAGETEALRMLETCASSQAHFYNASDGEQLRLAFRDIALRVSRLRLSE